MKVTYEGYTWVPKYEQRDGVCPMIGFYATETDANAVKGSLIKECVLKRVTVTIEPTPTKTDNHTK